MNDNHYPSQAPRPPRFWATRYAIGFLVLGGIATYFLFSEHRAHFAGALPFALLLACPLLHVFMHRGHSGHDHGGEAAPPKRESQ